MPTYRMSFFFRTPDDEGWSENWYWDGASLALAQTEMDSLLTKRLDLLPTTFNVVDARVSDVAIRGDVAFTTMTVPIPGNYTVTTGAAVLEANVALMVQFIATPAPYFLRAFIRGLSSDVIVGRERIPNITWDASFASWAAQLTGSSYLARHRLTPPPHATYEYHNLASLGAISVGARKPGRPFGLLRGRR